MSGRTRAAAATATIGLAVIGVQLLGVPLASAHTNSVTGTATCQKDGTYTVRWTITNDWTTDETATISGHTPAGSTVTVSALQLAAKKSGLATQTGIPGTSKTATLTVHGEWSDAKNDASGTVALDGRCGSKKLFAATAPSATDGDCVDNGITSPSVVVPSARDITYRLDGRPVDAGTHAVSPGKHVVTATSSVLRLTGRTSWTYRLDSAVTRCGVTPATPAVRQAECTTTGATTPSITVDHTSGISYTVSNSSPEPGETVKVTAVAKPGHVLTDLPRGWRKSGSSATYRAKFEQLTTCNGTDADSTSQGSTGSGSDSNGLAATGSETGTLVFGGFALLLIGSALTFRGRRTPSVG